MSINTESIPATLTDARFKVVSQMALRGFDVDQVCFEVYTFDGQLRLVVTYAGCISGNLINTDETWTYKRYCHNVYQPGVSLDQAVVYLVDDLWVRCKKCKLPLLQVGNKL